VNIIPLVVDCTIAESRQQFDCVVTELTQTVSVGIDTAIVTTGTPPYVGDYIVIPQTNEQILPTNGLRMTDDVTVTEIPYYETSNESGITVFIANNLNND
jgi:hypothetical protein